jgi:hypothetical protein
VCKCWLLLKQHNKTFKAKTVGECEKLLVGLHVFPFAAGLCKQCLRKQIGRPCPRTYPVRANVADPVKVRRSASNAFGSACWKGPRHGVGTCRPLRTLHECHRREGIGADARGGKMSAGQTGGRARQQRSFQINFSPPGRAYCSSSRSSSRGC